MSAPPCKRLKLSTKSDSALLNLCIYSDTKNAVWGGLMTAGAKAKTIKGVIVDGRCRDLAEHRQAKFPVCCLNDA